MDDRTELSALGEFGLIERLTAGLEHVQPTTINGVGDDAAVIDAGDKFLLVSTDMLVEGVHFDLTYVPLTHLGYKAVVVNLSDIYAMNGTPTQITVSIAVSNRFSVEALELLYEGIKKACSLYKVDLVGGDTTTAVAGLTISITAIGEVKKDKISKRSGGKPNDLIIVSGDLGAALMGLHILEREKSVFKDNPESQPVFEGADYVLERQLKPEARMDVIRFLEESDIVPTSMIDISDGLASELIHLCKMSDTCVEIYADRLPIDHQTISVAGEFELDAHTCALNGGEDYELLFSVTQSDYDKVKSAKGLTVIGHYTEKASGMNLVDPSGTSIPLKAQGWNHFKS